jgi:uncharacterized protein (DUF58 family)
MSLAHAIHDQVLSRLGDVSVAARQAVEALLSGAHRSVRRGLSVEFAGHRPYLPGDDLRRMDWGVWARTDRLEVRLYEEETRLRATLVVDASGSMGYGRSGRGVTGGSKLDYARTIAAALGFLMVRSTDAVGLAVVDTGIRHHHPPSAAMGALLNLLDRLAACPAGGDTALGPVLERLAPLVNRRGVVFVLTDGYDDPERLLHALRLLRHRKQDVRLLQIVDPDEETFPFGGSLDVHGLEAERPIELDGDRVRAWYRTAVADHRRHLAEGCHGMGAQVEVLRTDEPPATALVRILTRAMPTGGRR